MRAAAIFGPGNISRAVATFQGFAKVEWTSLIEQADVVVVFGGDGTVHRQLSSLVELQVPLLVVPCGSGNDFAHALNLRSVHDSVEAWRKFVAGESPERVIDLGGIKALNPTIGEAKPKAADEASAIHYFCCVAGVGIDTAIARRANNLPRWIRARGGYALCATQEFVRFSPLPMKISSNGFLGALRPTMLAAVANAPAYGGGMKIAPHAKLDDGQLDLCVVHELNMFKLFCLFPSVYFGRHLGFREVEYRQLPEARIETEFPLDVYADGEFICQTPVEFSVVPRALKVLSIES